MAENARATGTETSLAEIVLAHAQADRVVIQEFRPLAESIEWRLGQRYWAEHGSQAFRREARPERIFTLELGLGVGLFARYFLDAFRDLCTRHGKDYYDRLTYVCGDRSLAMLRDAGRYGIFSNHPGRYLLRVVDALEPERGPCDDVALAGCGPRPLQAVFLNYLLDCLPVTALEVAGDEVRQLCVRTCLARGVDLAEYTTLTAEQLARLADSTDADDQRELLAVFGLFTSEYAYHAVERDRVPYGEFAAAFCGSGRRLLHNYGAIQALERLLGLLRDDGFVLVNDYGQTIRGEAGEPEHQRFAGSTAVGLNFPLLKAYFGESGRCHWEEPLGDNGQIYSRLLGRRPAYETLVRFHECFGRAAWDRIQGPLQQARQMSQMGRLEAALANYRTALERQPYNRLLLGEVAHFLTFPLRNPKAGLDLVKVGLAANPTSFELWNTLGDCLYEWGGSRDRDALEAYRRAGRLGAGDPRSRLGLAWVHTRQKDYPAALARIAEALALDRTGQHGEQLLQKQSEVLARLSQQNQQEQMRMANRVNTGRREGGEGVDPERWGIGGLAAPGKGAVPVAEEAKAVAVPQALPAMGPGHR